MNNMNLLVKGPGIGRLATHRRCWQSIGWEELPH